RHDSSGVLRVNRGGGERSGPRRAREERGAKVRRAERRRTPTGAHGSLARTDASGTANCGARTRARRANPGTGRRGGLSRGGRRGSRETPAHPRGNSRGEESG